MKGYAPHDALRLLELLGDSRVGDLGPDGYRNAGQRRPVPGAWEDAMKLTPRQHHDDTVTDHHPDHAEHTEHTETAGASGHTVREERVLDDAAARDRFGGANWGAAFFGWLVAVGMTALLTGILAAVATGIGYSQGITQSDAERAAGTFCLVTALVLLAVLLVAYYAGGYVAGRMSRFDGGRQGALVWVIGLVITAVAAVLGWIAGDQYNLLDRVDVPQIPIPQQRGDCRGHRRRARRAPGDAARSGRRRQGGPPLPPAGGPRARGRRSPRLRTLFASSHAGHRV